MCELKPAKPWWTGSQDVEPFMPPIATAISRHIERSDPAWTDIYNRAYEAVYTALQSRAQPANEPLTLDELRGMDGEAVYLVDMEPVEYGWEDGYYLVDTDEDVAFNGIRKFNLKLCAGFAYRTKPEQPEREADHGR